MKVTLLDLAMCVRRFFFATLRCSSDRLMHAAAGPAEPTNIDAAIPSNSVAPGSPSSVSHRCRTTCTTRPARPATPAFAIQLFRRSLDDFVVARPPLVTQVGARPGTSSGLHLDLWVPRTRPGGAGREATS